MNRAELIKRLINALELIKRLINSG